MSEFNSTDEWLVYRLEQAEAERGRLRTALLAILPMTDVGRVDVITQGIRNIVMDALSTTDSRQEPRSLRFPEIRVTRKGTVVDRVEWDPRKDGEPLFDITGMHVTKVESEIVPDGSPPMVKVTFMARVVEFDQDDPRAANSHSETS